MPLTLNVATFQLIAFMPPAGLPTILGHDRTYCFQHPVVQPPIGGHDPPELFISRPVENSSGRSEKSVTLPPASSTTMLPAAWSQIFSRYSPERGTRRYTAAAPLATAAYLT